MNERIKVFWIEPTDRERRWLRRYTSSAEHKCGIMAQTPPRFREQPGTPGIVRDAERPPIRTASWTRATLPASRSGSQSWPSCG
jgi:hypothetical protein